MNTNIFDYVNYYKEKSFNEVLFNKMDAFVYAILVHLPIQNFENGINISNLSKFVDFNDIRGAVGPIAAEMLPIIENSRRYKDVGVFDFIKQEDEEVQFGAVTFRFNGNTFVAYEGTNSSIIGWIENFMLTINYPTKTQQLAIEYLNRLINSTDSKIFVGGHSKGGNLAMAASMDCSEAVFNRIEKIYNFDGPGFRKVEFESERFARMNQKVESILPGGSLIGILMYNKNYEFIEADGVGFKEHYPTSWNTFGEFFVPSKQSMSSKRVQERLYRSIDELKEDDVKTLLSSFRRFAIRNNINSSNDFKNIKFEELRALGKEIKDVDERTKKLFFDIMRILFNPDSKESKKFIGEDDNEQ